MPLFLYNIALTLALPAMVLRLYWRSRKAPAYRQRMAERFGAIPFLAQRQADRPCVWIHAVSVGEATAAGPLVEALLNNYPALQIVVTTMTPTGSDRVRLLFGDRVLHSYAPYDHPFLLMRFIKRVQPDVLVIMETELWPNLLRRCSRHGIRLMLANARLSAKSAFGYQHFSGLSRDMLRRFDAIAVQGEADRDRLLRLGAASDRVKITGSLKFNVSSHADDALPPPLSLIKASGRPVWIAASTRGGEEAPLLAAHRRVLEKRPETLLLLVPRHPERFAEVLELCQHQGFRVQRRSKLGELASDCQVLLGDSMGELTAYYRCADLAFVGGSLVDKGSQNVLEPASLGLPVLVGPSQFNFAAICQGLAKAGGLRTVGNSEELAAAVSELLGSPQTRELMGEAGKALVAANQQALPGHLALLEPLLPKS